MLDISEMCRVCRDESDCLVDIYTEPCASMRDQEQEPPLATMLRDCSGCSVDRKDGMPQFICVECAEATRNAFRLRRQCRKSHQYFDQLRLMMKELEDLESCLTINDNIDPEIPVLVIDAGETAEPCEPQGLEPLFVELVELKCKSPEPQPLTPSLPDNNELTKSDSPVKTPDAKQNKRARSYSNSKSWSPESEKVADAQQDDDETWKAPKRRKSKKARRPFRCQHCKQSFAQNINLRTHMRVHTGERPYKCSLCPRSFAQKGNLQSHTRCHTGERPFGCSNCPKRFRQFGQLQVHTRTHTGEHPYQCSICQYSFKQQNGLQKHMIVHTGEKTRSCSQEKKK
ncbi:zinc finger protein 32 [Drosophila erecta]|uniref:Protein krueppel n=1 Tax=Drosophila erecta TaxID=7220 RepID=B3NCZ9_DROER|nr:zinc finger protein 32 [Drosophila erecta]EDV51721.1 uncharacterized protein Dere_GG13743 [Drosophila erecta]